MEKPNAIDLSEAKMKERLKMLERDLRHPACTSSRLLIGTLPSGAELHLALTRDESQMFGPGSPDGEMMND